MTDPIDIPAGQTRRLSAEMRQELKNEIAQKRKYPYPELFCALHDLDLADGEIHQLQQKCKKISGYVAEAEAHRTLLKERDAKIARLEEDRSNLIAITALIQSKLQPAGSPPPGGIMRLAYWIVETTVERIARLDAATVELQRSLSETQQLCVELEQERDQLQIKLTELEIHAARIKFAKTYCLELLALKGNSYAVNELAEKIHYVLS